MSLRFIFILDALLYFLLRNLYGDYCFLRLCNLLVQSKCSVQNKELQELQDQLVASERKLQVSSHSGVLHIEIKMYMKISKFLLYICLL